MNPNLWILLVSLASPAETLRLDFEQAVRLALRRSPVQSEVSATRVKAATTLAQGVGSLLPTLSGSIGYGTAESRSLLNPESTFTEHLWTGSLTISQVVFDPAVFTGVVAAMVNASYQATEAQDQAARLLLDITTDYLGLLKAQLLRDAARTALQQAEENLRLVGERERLGSASQIDRLRAQVLRSQAEIQLLSAEKGVKVAQENLKAVAGIIGNIAIVATETLGNPPEMAIDNPDSLLAEIERRNPGAALARKARAAAAAQVAGAVGRGLPSVSLYWRSSYSDTAFPRSHAVWRGHDVVSSGITVTWPLLDLKSFIIGIVDAGAGYRKSRVAATRARLTLRASAAAAILGYQEAKRQLEAARTNLELNQELGRLAQEQFRLGSLSLTDLFAVEANLASARASYIGALCDSYIQAAQINYLLGMTQPVVQK
ncbi:MAG: TolC family protein [candidate division WOR-3 bacterium]